MKCPNCKTEIPKNWDKYEPIICAGCGFRLELKKRHLLSLSLLAPVLGVILLNLKKLDEDLINGYFLAVFLVACVPAGFYIYYYLIRSGRLKATDIEAEEEIEEIEENKNRLVAEKIRRFREQQKTIKANKSWWQFWL